MIPLANSLASDINGSKGSETRNPRLGCLFAFEKGVQADQVDGGGEEVGQRGFVQAEVASTAQPEHSHHLGMGSFDARALGMPLPKLVRLLPQTGLVQDLPFGLRANGEEPGIGGGTGAQRAARTGSTLLQAKADRNIEMSILIGFRRPFDTAFALGTDGDFGLPLNGK